MLIFFCLLFCIVVVVVAIAVAVAADAVADIFVVAAVTVAVVYVAATAVLRSSCCRCRRCLGAQRSRGRHGDSGRPSRAGATTRIRVRAQPRESIRPPRLIAPPRWAAGYVELVCPPNGLLEDINVPFPNAMKGADPMGEMLRRRPKTNDTAVTGRWAQLVIQTSNWYPRQRIRGVKNCLYSSVPCHKEVARLKQLKKMMILIALDVVLLLLTGKHTQDTDLNELHETSLITRNKQSSPF